MKNILIDLKNSILATIVFAIVCCGIYPVAVWGVGKVLFPHQADGSLDVSFNKFKELVSNAINLYYVQNPASEVPPGPLNGVPLN